MAAAKTSALLLDLMAARERLDRLVRRGGPPGPRPAGSLAEWIPSVDIVESETSLKILMELPGMEAKDVSITVDRNDLTIKGERRISSEDRRRTYQCMECGFGKFSRSFTLPAFVDIPAIRSEMKSGMLILILPKGQKQASHQKSSNPVDATEGEHHE